MRERLPGAGYHSLGFSSRPCQKTALSLLILLVAVTQKHDVRNGALALVCGQVPLGGVGKHRHVPLVPLELAVLDLDLQVLHPVDQLVDERHVAPGGFVSSH